MNWNIWHAKLTYLLLKHERRTKSLPLTWMLIGFVVCQFAQWTMQHLSLLWPSQSRWVLLSHTQDCILFIEIVVDILDSDFLFCPFDHHRKQGMKGIIGVRKMPVPPTQCLSHSLQMNIIIYIFAIHHEHHLLRPFTSSVQLLRAVKCPHSFFSAFFFFFPPPFIPSFFNGVGFFWFFSSPFFQVLFFWVFNCCNFFLPLFFPPSDLKKKSTLIPTCCFASACSMFPSSLRAGQVQPL